MYATAAAIRLFSLNWRFKWIPNLRETETFEIFDVYGSELRDALPQQTQRNTPVVRAAAGKAPIAQPRPKGVVKRTTIRRKAQKLPMRMLSECFAHLHCFSSTERPGDNDWI